jgi:hypothetical protein
MEDKEVVSVRPNRKVVLLLATSVLLAAGVQAGPRNPKVGTRLPSVLQEARMRNAPVGVAAPKGGWVVYVFAPGSAVADRNQAKVEALAGSLPADWILLSVATSAKEVPAFLEGQAVTIPVLTQVPEKVLAAYGGAGGGPRVYILDKDWKLLELLEGPLEGKVAKRLADRFKVTWKPGAERRAVASAAGEGEKRPPSMCRDAKQQEYSPGAKADALGLVLRCGMGGMWAAGS